MCNAKMLLCGAAALVLVAGGLLYQARAVAVQRERAEAARRQAEEAQRAFNEQAAEARRPVQQQADNVRQGLAPNLVKALAELAELRAAQLQRFLQERQKLSELTKKLEMEERETLAKIDAKASELQSQLKNRPAPAADKLDRILERLDRIEQRLERLERGGPSSGGKK